MDEKSPNESVGIYSRREEIYENLDIKE